jgi:hypothetical protein
VQVIPSLKSSTELAQEAEDRAEKRSADRGLVTWTAALFFATVGLILATCVLGYFAYRQLRDMKASIAAAQKAADAADMSARAAIGIELPIIRALPSDIEHLDEPIVEGEGYATANLDGAPLRYSALSEIEFKTSAALSLSRSNLSSDGKLLASSRTSRATIRKRSSFPTPRLSIRTRQHSRLTLIPPSN